MGKKFYIVSLLVAFCLAYSFGPRCSLQDFTIYWKALQQWLQGGSPYSLPHHSTYLEGRLGWVDQAQDVLLSVWSPPTFLAAMAIFSAHSLSWAKIIYLSAALATLISWIFLSIRTLFATWQLNNLWSKTAVIVLVLIAFPWFAWVEMWDWGGMSILSSVSLFILAAKQGNLTWKVWALVLFLSSLKPHPIALTIAIIFCLSKPIQRVDILKGATIAGSLTLIPIALSPTLISDFLGLSYAVPEKYRRFCDTISASLVNLGISGKEATISSVFILGTVLYLAVKRLSQSKYHSPVMVAALMTPLSVFFSPYAWLHDYIVCSAWLWGALLFVNRDKHRTALVFISGVSLNLIYLLIVLILPSVPTATIGFTWAFLTFVIFYSTPLGRRLDSDRATG